MGMGGDYNAVQVSSRQVNIAAEVDFLGCGLVVDWGHTECPRQLNHRLTQTIPATHAVSARYCGTVDFSFRKNML